MESVRIVSDGLVTRVYDAKTGAEIQMVTAVEISPMLPGKLVEAKLTFVGVELDIIAAENSSG